MSLTGWQENRAVELRAKGFPPSEVARVVGSSADEVRRAWPRLVPNKIGAGLIALPKPKEEPKPVTKAAEPRPTVVWPKQLVGGVLVTPAQRLPAAPPEVRAVLREVAEKHGLSVRLMLAQRNLFILVHARQEAMWRLRSEQNRSWKRIAKIFQCDHTTVIHGFASHVARTQGK